MTRTAAAVLGLLMGATPAFAHPAWGLVVDRSGVVFFTDVHTNSVWMRAADGGLTRLAQGVHSHPLWFDRENDALYGEHVWWSEAEQRWSSYLWKLSRTGSLDRVASVPEPLRWVTDAQGVRYRAEGSRVRRLNPDGTSVMVGGDPFASLQRSTGGVNSVSLGPDGALYVADADYRCVWKLEGEGEPRRVYQTGWLLTPMGVAVTEEAMYVLEDRPNGPAMILSYWAGPRLKRVRAGETELVAVVDRDRGWMVAGMVVVAAGIVGVLRWRRSRH